MCYLEWLFVSRILFIYTFLFTFFIWYNLWFFSCIRLFDLNHFGRITGTRQANKRFWGVISFSRCRSDAWRTAFRFAHFLKLIIVFIENFLFKSSHLLLVFRCNIRHDWILPCHVHPGWHVFYNCGGDFVLHSSTSRPTNSKRREQQQRRSLKLLIQGKT